MAYANRIRTLVLHPDPFTRAGLSATFANYSDLELVNIDTQFAALTPGQLATNAVDVVVADYAYGADLANLLSRHGGAGESCHILVVTSVDREWEIRDALARGVRGYVLFGCTLDELAAGVRAVKQGQRHLSAQVAQRLADSLSGEALTSREEEVLRLVVDGLCNKTIARCLDISVGTVKSHLKGIFDKLDVKSRTQALCAAERRGLLGPLPQPKEPATSISILDDAPAAHLPRFEACASRHPCPSR